MWVCAHRWRGDCSHGKGLEKEETAEGRGGLPVAGWISARWVWPGSCSGGLACWQPALWRCVVMASQHTVREVPTPGTPTPSPLRGFVFQAYLFYLLWQYHWISMRLSWVMKKGKLRSCHQGKRKCHTKLVMTFGRNEKRDCCVF